MSNKPNLQAPLNGNSKGKNIVYQEIHSVKDNATGEVVETHNRRLIKMERTPDFIMFFTEHIAFLENLSSLEKSVLFHILQHYVGIQNIIFISAATKQDISKALGVGISAIQKATKSLFDKKIIIKGIVKESQVYLNPYLFGKGNWENIRKMRQEIAYDFDFENLEMKESRKISAQYEDGADIHSCEVVESHEYEDDKGVVHQDVHIQEKLPAEPLYIEEKKDNDLAILNAQNESKRLAIEEMQLKIKMKEMGIL